MFGNHRPPHPDDRLSPPELAARQAIYLATGRTVEEIVICALANRLGGDVLLGPEDTKAGAVDHLMISATGNGWGTHVVTRPAEECCPDHE